MKGLAGGRQGTPSKCPSSLLLARGREPAVLGTRHVAALCLRFTKDRNIGYHEPRKWSGCIPQRRAPRARPVYVRA